MVESIIIVVVLAVILGGAAFYVWRTKKRGKRCIGCPDSGSCHGNCSCCGGCGSREDSK